MRKSIQASPSVVGNCPTPKSTSKNEQTIWNGRTVALAGGILALAAIGIIAFLYSKSGNSTQTTPGSTQTTPGSTQITATQREELSKGLIPLTEQDYRGSIGERLAFSKSVQTAVISKPPLLKLFSLKGIFSNVLDSPRYASVSPLQGYPLSGEFVFSSVMDLVIGTACLSMTANMDFITDKICSIFPKTCEELMNHDEFSPLKKAPKGVDHSNYEHKERRFDYLESLLVREYKYYENECFIEHPYRDAILSGLRFIGNYLFDPIVGSQGSTDRGIYHLYNYAATVPRFAKAARHMVKHVGGEIGGLAFYSDGENVYKKNPLDGLFRKLYLLSDDTTAFAILNGELGLAPTQFDEDNLHLNVESLKKSDLKPMPNTVSQLILASSIYKYSA